jgi:hypothetical protein
MDIKCLLPTAPPPLLPFAAATAAAAAAAAGRRRRLEPLRLLKGPLSLHDGHVGWVHEQAPATVPRGLQGAVEGAGSSTVHGA